MTASHDIAGNKQTSMSCKNSKSKLLDYSKKDSLIPFISHEFYD
jgi:hypothetical protein